MWWPESVISAGSYQSETLGESEELKSACSVNYLFERHKSWIRNISKNETSYSGSQSSEGTMVV